MLAAMITPSKPPANVVAPRNWHFQYLADHLRPDEIEHWLAISGAASFDPDVAALAYMNTPGLKFTLLGRDGMPVVAGGFHEVEPGVWQGWMVGTLAGWHSHWRMITKASRWLMGQLFALGAQRLCVNTIASRTAATCWYARALGLRLEGTLAGAGHRGEDFVYYARTARGA